MYWIAVLVIFLGFLAYLLMGLALAAMGDGEHGKAFLMLVFGCLLGAWALMSLASFLNQALVIAK